MAASVGDDEFDVVRFLDSATEIVDQYVHGESGLLGVRRVVEIGQWALPADGVTFVEFGPLVGRFIATSGEVGSLLGRRVDTGDPVLRGLTDGERITVVDVAALPADLRPDGTGSAWALVGRVTRYGRVAGVLIAYLAGEVDPRHVRRRALFGYLAAVVARLYRESPGLPVHGDPGVRAPADATALIDADGMVSWINPRDRNVLDATGVTVGAPLPLPVPGPGQIIDHQLSDGRWLKLLVKRLPDGVTHAITIRDVTEARRWEQSRELFLALTSHELRTPVTVIKGFADTLTDRWDVLDDRGRRHAALVLGQRAGDLARLLDRLLSAVGEPGVPPVVSRFDLGDAIREAVDTLPIELRARVRLAIGPGTPPVFGEHVSITSVINELIANAGKYAPVTAGAIEVHGVYDDRTVGFRVVDRGIGVRPEHVESAFERFWQADTGDHRRYSGVGLGLYLVRRIVERQNGWVSLRPRESGGTVAEVRLPRGDLNIGAQRA